MEARQELLEKLNVLLELTKNEKELFVSKATGQSVYDPRYDETMRFKVDPIVHYGLENVEAAIETLKTLNSQSNLSLIAKALQDYNDQGFAVIVGSDDHDAEFIGENVIAVLNGLKCSFNSYYNSVENSYFIEDNM